MAFSSGRPTSVLILDWIFSAQFTVTPLDTGRQVFFAQFMPLALGATLRAWRAARKPLRDERHAARPVVVERRRQDALIRERRVGLAHDDPVVEPHGQLVERRR